MSRKKITNKSDDAADDVDFYIIYSPDMTEIMLTMKSHRTITPNEYFDCLHNFLNTASENPDDLFVEDVDVSEMLH